MKYERVTSPINNYLLKQFWNGTSPLHSFFAYKVEQQSYEKRAEYLKNRTYKREEISRTIRSYMERFGITDEVNHNLTLLQNGALVIAGGQQAGILTGPLFTVYKAISVILLAKEQSEKLNVPVVPLFWVAGEDHDIDEINHTFSIQNKAVKKCVFGEKNSKKIMASNTNYDKQKLISFVEDLFKQYGETNYTKGLIQEIREMILRYETFTDIFSAIMHYFFAKHGLLMIDSTYKPLRNLESEFFEQIIEKNDALAEAVVKKEKQLMEHGYGCPIDAKIESANLFFVKDGERFLLERKDSLFFNGLGGVKLTQEELLNIAKNEPEKLSNNVVTRPLMQDFIFPILAFVGGPGELAYWATLKTAFETMEMEMPLFIPRLSITLITRQIDQLLEKHRLEVEDVYAGKASEQLQEFIESIRDENILQYINEMEFSLKQQYEQLTTQLQMKEINIQKTIDRNVQYHLQQFAYLKDKIHEDVLRKHEVIIGQYELIENLFRPNNKLQERVFNPFQFLNEYGPTLIDDLLTLPFKLEAEHYVVKI